MSNQVPLRAAEVAQSICLTRKLLHSIFAEDANARRVRFTHQLHRKCFTDPHQRDFYRIAPGAASSSGDSFADARNIFDDGHCRDLTTEDTEEGKSKNAEVKPESFRFHFCNPTSDF